MAYEETLKSITLDADASIGTFTGVAGLRGAPANAGGLQYRFVKVTGEHKAGLAVLAADTVVGVLQNKPQGVGHAATVGIFGVSMVEAGGAVSAGASVTCDTVGRATASASNVKGIALHSAAVAGELIPVLLRLS
jgi:hypothetical protein